VHGPRAAVRHGVDQHVHPVRERDAARRLPAEHKQSGYGKDMSIYALEEYTQTKHVMVSL